MTGSRTIDRPLMVAGAAMAGLAVLLGAFGAHALDGRLDGTQFGWWQTAVQYQMWHALAVVMLAMTGTSQVRRPAWLLAGGAFLFSATLYAMALGAPHWLGALTPIGGAAMIAGWALLTWRAALGRLEIIDDGRD